MTDKLFFYVKPNCVSEGKFTLSENESHHIHRVLRLNLGERIWLIDGLGHGYEGELCSFNGTVKGKIIKSYKRMGENSWNLQLAIAVLKKNRMELLVEKATELGVNKLSFVRMDNSGKQKIQIPRLEKIVKTASKQCGRTNFPSLKEYDSLKDFLYLNNTKTIAAHKSGDSFLSTFLFKNKMKPSSVIIGPEGDFSKEELSLIQQNNIPIISLGNRRLRSETAGVYALTSMNEYYLNKC